MGTQNTSARPRAQSRNDGKSHASRGDNRRWGGVVHDNARHTTRFTVVGNHLAQHGDLSLTAIGLAVHIQSLPTGAQVDIDTLATRFPEGKTRIAASLRELETHGYLRRTRVRTDGGRMVTRTVSCNQPGRTGGRDDPGPPPRRTAEKPPRRRALPAVPQPVYPTPDLLQTALGVLSGLRREDPRLLISATDAEHLVPGVAAWLERELTPEAVHRALTTALPPEPLHRPAALLAHRLTAQLPPLPPFRPQVPAVVHPVQNCDTCNRGHRAPEPGPCRDCSSAAATHVPTDTEEPRGQLTP
ncbi:helix-turn-helix domain-containing protein [Streptomyces sp. WAC01280]|uniref:helix-turn-helix domain-containing protein n=1 Tax=Streptomyces sp. WAC01280 TaxID=2487424 RepID=UPI000F79F691|nr:helix-turn-helix domain-containing protein [Streptomyces sp. WAC01280]RSS54026.1 helix-turn-helix domain-containing protein [Streptomyces sp. WAC01280]